VTGKSEYQRRVASGGQQRPHSQTMFFSATLQASDVRRLINDITEFATWVDLKGSVHVPEVRRPCSGPWLSSPRNWLTLLFLGRGVRSLQTVHHVVRLLDPADVGTFQRARAAARTLVQTDGIHARGTERRRAGGRGTLRVRLTLGFPAFPAADGTDNLPPYAQGRVDASTPASAAQGLSAEALSEAIKHLKALELVRLIRRFAVDRAMIFCRTKLDCDHVEAFLRRYGREPDAARALTTAYRWSARPTAPTLQNRELVDYVANGGNDPASICVVLHADRSNQERQANLDRFRAGLACFLICTDVAARGIDIKGLPFVISTLRSVCGAGHTKRAAERERLASDPVLACRLHAAGRGGHLCAPRGPRRPRGRHGPRHLAGLAGAREGTVAGGGGRIALGMARQRAVASVERGARGQVWYHVCKSKHCTNTDLTSNGGCAIWYEEPALIKVWSMYLSADEAKAGWSDGSRFALERFSSAQAVEGYLDMPIDVLTPEAEAMLADPNGAGLRDAAAPGRRRNTHPHWLPGGRGAGAGRCRACQIWREARQD